MQPCHARPCKIDNIIVLISCSAVVLPTSMCIIRIYVSFHSKKDPVHNIIA